MKELRQRSDAMEKRLRELEIDNAVCAAGHRLFARGRGCLID
jgi:hypothetical protein